MGYTTPPNSSDAERSLLGSLLIDNDAFSGIEAVVKEGDFYAIEHQMVYRAIGNLFYKGEPMDLVMMAEELRRLDMLDKIGGTSYLIGLMDGTPTSAYVHSYAETVREKRIARDVIAGAGNLMNLALADTLTTDELLAKVDEFATKSIRDPVDSTSDAEAFDAAMSYLEGTAKVKTGFVELDRLTGGIAVGDLTTVAARSTTGKALALDTPILTPRGWSTMGQLKVGDKVFDEKGKPCSILQATKVMVGRRCYLVRFKDGSEIVADAEHQWATRKRESYGIRTTAEISIDMMADEGKKRPYRHAIEVCEPLQLPEVQLPLHPYLLGVWLGDGTSSQATITNPDYEIRARIESLGYPTTDRKTSSTCPTYGLTDGDRSNSRNGSTVQAQLRELGVLNNKHIPFDYLMANQEQRTELLRGLMDTDGYCDVRGLCEYTTIDSRFAEQVCELIRSLGYKANVTEGEATIGGRLIGPKYRISFTPRQGSDVFSLPRKAARVSASKRFDKSRWRSIVEVRPVESVPVRCIEVDSPSHLFLAGKSLIPTHNSSFIYQVAIEMSNTLGKPVGILSPDQEKGEIFSVLASRVSQVPLDVVKGTPTKEQRERFAAGARYVREKIAPRLIIRDGLLPHSKIEQEAGRLIRQGCSAIFLDTLQACAYRGSKLSNRDQIDDTCRTLKGIAREYRMPVIAVSQVKQDVDYRENKRPLDYDCSESKNIYDLSQTMLFMYREDVSGVGGDSATSPLASMATSSQVEVRVAKQKTGRKNAVARLQFMPSLQSFKNPSGPIPGITIRGEPFK